MKGSCLCGRVAFEISDALPRFEADSGAEHDPITALV